MSRVGRTAPVLETLMIEPPPPATIRSPTSAASRNGPLRLTPITLSKSSSVTSLSVSYTRRDAGVVDQHVDAAEVAVDVLDQRVELVPVPDVAGVRQRRGRPSARSAAATSSQASALRLATTTSAPACAKPRAIARPSPRVPPVTTATRPERSKRSRSRRA